MWFCGRRIRAGRSTGRATEEFREGGDDESRVPHYFDSGTVGRDWIHRGVPRGGSYPCLLAIDSASGAFGRRDVVARAKESAQGEIERAVRGGGRSARLKERQLGCRTLKSCSLPRYSNRFREKGLGRGCLAYLCG